MRVRHVVLIACVSTLGAGTACELFIGDGVTVSSADSDGGADASDSGQDGTTTSEPACFSAQPPMQTLGVDGGIGVLPYVFAIRSLDLATPVLGFDLDSTCTCCTGCSTRGDAGSSCIPPPPSPSMAPANECDSDGGVDIKINRLIQGVSVVLGNHFVTESDDIAACGQRTVMIALTDYDGTANDPLVHMLATSAFGIRESHGDAGEPDASSIQCSTQAGMPFFRPKWDGTDRWAVLSSSLTGDNLPLSAPIPGYVKDYQLVLDARLSQDLTGLSIKLGIFGPSPVEFGSPIIIATLIPLDANGNPLPEGGAPTQRPPLLAMTGVVGGRASRDDLLRSISYSTTDGVNPNCNDPNFLAAKGQLCGNADVAQYVELDNMNQPCTALSAIIAFTAGPAQIGQTVDDAGIVTPDACVPASLSCDTN
jgi:hypothetical protein